MYERGLKRQINVKEKQWETDILRGLRCEYKEEVHPPGPPRRPASEIHLRPKPDHVSRTVLEFVRRCACSDPAGRKRGEGAESAAVALHKGVTKKKAQKMNIKMN